MTIYGRSSQSHPLVSTLARHLFPLLVISTSCGDRLPHRADSASGPSMSSTAVSDTARVSLADFQALRYLEGDWRGSGYEGGPFYESYHFVNDSTIDMTGWSDSTRRTVQEQAQYRWRGGMVTTSKGGVLVKVDAAGHHFATSSYGWVFKPISADRWMATVGTSASYTMERLPR
jgi:hypothetical protein